MATPKQESDNLKDNPSHEELSKRRSTKDLQKSANVVYNYISQVKMPIGSSKAMAELEDAWNTIIAALKLEVEAEIQDGSENI